MLSWGLRHLAVGPGGSAPPYTPARACPVGAPPPLPLGRPGRGHSSPPPATPLAAHWGTDPGALIPKRKCHSGRHSLGGGGGEFKWKRSKFLKCLGQSWVLLPRLPAHRSNPAPSTALIQPQRGRVSGPPPPRQPPPVSQGQLGQSKASPFVSLPIPAETSCCLAVKPGPHPTPHRSGDPGKT